MEKHLSELRSQGWDDQALAIERAECESVAAAGVIWPENWTIARAFRDCEWTLAGVGVGPVVHAGIAGAEIESICRLQHVPRREWPDVLLGIRLMTAAARPILNAKKT